ncbi:MAG: hypothetical protein VXX36_12320 [Verrucomicrobiota bacterium]|nr:hypothetical protein [Verrucomicrobiota bacterium]
MRPSFRLFLFLLLFFGISSRAEAQRIILDGEGDVKIRPLRVNTSSAEEDEIEEEDNAAEAEPLSAQISAHILKLAKVEREKRLKFMQVVIDDVVRLCKLNEVQQDQLLLAAKGAAERSMKDWHEQAERYFRTRLDGADSDAAKEMLDGMGNVNFGGNRSEEEGESLELWKDTLSVVLNEDQISRYEEVLEQRHLDRIDAFSRMSISTLDGYLRLTPDQKEDLGKLVHQAAVSYLDDVQRYWGDYFEKGTLMSLANANEDEVLREILTKKQLERLQSATSNFDHFWETKKRNRRAEEKDAERRKKEANEEKLEDEKTKVN